VTSLVTTSQSEVVILSVDSDVLVVSLGKLLNGSLDSLHSTRLTHLLSGVVGVAPCTVPVTRQRLGVEADLDAPLFSNADEEEASHPEVVTHVNASARANLELPLRRHDLGIDTRDVNTGI
jgi:hypothetical protein